MRRRRLLYIAFLLGVAVFLALWGPRILSRLTGSAGGFDPYGRISQTFTALVYEIEKDNWLDFTVPPRTTVKILSNAVTAKKNVPMSGSLLPYALRYQLLDKKGKVLKEKSYFHDASLTRYSEPGSGQTFSGSFFIPGDFVPMDGKFILLDLKARAPGTHRIRIKLEQKARQISRVVLRLYWEKVFPEYKLKPLWERKTRESQQRLARGNIYPVELLYPRERRNLVRRQWEVMAPGGVPGKDFRRYKLYILKEHDGVPVYYQDNPFGEVIPYGQVLEPRWLGSVPLPPEGGRFRFHFSPLPVPRGHPPGLLKGDIVLHWYGRAGEEQTETAVRWRDENLSHDISLEGGLVIVQAPGYMVMRVFRLGDRGEPMEEVSPEPVLGRVYQCEPGFPVEYRVSQSGESATPFRFDFRCPVPTMAGATVVYRFLDAGGKVIRKGEVPLDNVPSLFERIGNGDPVSVRTRRYVRLPAGVSRIRFHSSGAAVFISASNRPPGLPKSIDVPSDYYAFTRRLDLEKDWFSLEPSNRKILQQNLKSHMVSLRTPPPERDPDVLAGLYLWESFSPLGKARLRPLFITGQSPASGEQRTESLAYVYTRLPRHRALDAALVEQKGPGAPVRPRLVYLRSRKSPNRLTLEMDGSLMPFTLTGQQGEFILPPLEPGNHRWQIKREAGVEIYLSHLDWTRSKQLNSSAQPLARRRLAAEVTRRGLTFTFRKLRSEETLSLQVFTPSQPGNADNKNNEDNNIVSPLILEAELSGLRSRVRDFTGAWTFTRRVFRITPAPGSVPILGTPGDQADGGQVMFFPLGEDIPPGDYRLRVRLRKTQEQKRCYAMLYRVTPGTYEERQIHILRGEK